MEALKKMIETIERIVALIVGKNYTSPLDHVLGLNPPMPISVWI